MAKNLIEQFLDYATSKLTGPIGDDIYIKEEPVANAGLTGVAKYLAQFEQVQAESQALTGVAKYLARQAQVAPIAQPEAADQSVEVEVEAAVQEIAAPVSRVARYLAMQEASASTSVAAAASVEETQVISATEELAAPISRVAKYLARQAVAVASAVTETVAETVAKVEEAVTPEPAAPEQPVSRVARYLAGKEAAVSQPAAPVPAEAAPAPAAPEPQSRVAKYLAAQEAAAKPQQSEVQHADPAPSVESGSRVARYLAAISKEFKPETAPEQAAPVAEEQAPTAPMSRVEKYLASQNKSVAESAGLSTAVAKVVKDLGQVNIDDKASVVRLDDGKQCQAMTAKGTQCRNKSNLASIQLQVNGADYQFNACAQHNNGNFKPFAELL